MVDSTRRSLLKSGGAAVLLATAGCLGDISAATGGSDDPTYSRWMPTPDEKSLPISVQYMDYAAIREREDDLHSTSYERFTDSGPLDVPFVSIDETFSFSGVAGDAASPSHVVLGPDVGEAGRSERLEGPKFEDRGEHGEFDVYAGRDLSVAAGDDALAFAPNRESLERILDAAAGERDRYADADEHFDRLVAELGSAEYATVNRFQTDNDRIAELDEVVGFGTGWEFGPDRTTLTVVGVFPDAESADVDGVESLLDDAPGADEYDSIDVAASGRAVVADGTIATDRFDGLTPGGPDENPARARESPQASFSFDYDPSAESVTIVHQGGDTIPSTDLAVVVDGSSTDVQFADEYDEVTAGDSVTVDGHHEENDALQVVWESGSSSVVLAEFRFP